MLTQPGALQRPRQPDVGPTQVALFVAGDLLQDAADLLVYQGNEPGAALVRERLDAVVKGDHPRQVVRLGKDDGERLVEDLVQRNCRLPPAPALDLVAQQAQVPALVGQLRLEPGLDVELGRAGLPFLQQVDAAQLRLPQARQYLHDRLIKRLG